MQQPRDCPKRPRSHAAEISCSSTILRQASVRLAASLLPHQRRWRTTSTTILVILMDLLLGIGSPAEATLASDLRGRLAADSGAVAAPAAGCLLGTGLVAAGVDRARNGAHIVELLC